MDSTSRRSVKKLMTPKAIVGISAVSIIVFGVVLLPGMYKGTGVGGAVGDAAFKVMPFGKKQVVELKSQIETIKKTTVSSDQYQTLQRSYQDMARQLSEYRQTSVRIAELPAQIQGTPDQVKVNIAKLCGSGGEGVETSFFRVSETLRLYGSINTKLPAEQQKTKGLYENIQRCLSAIGSYSGPITGAQAETYQAIAQFQQTRKLKVDGVIGNGTFGEIRKAFEGSKAQPQIAAQQPGNQPASRPGMGRALTAGPSAQAGVQ